MEQRVEFVIAGAQKAGTSALHQYLRRHPQLFLPARKELHFFDNESLHWPGGDDLYDRYHQAFHEAAAGSIWGEATPIYMYWEPSVARICQYNPAIKLVLVLRNPITRAFSHWNMESRRGEETLGFLEALQAEEERCRAALPQQHRVFSYVARGHYCAQLQRIWNVLTASQTLVLKHDDLLNNPRASLDQIHAHLGVDHQAFSGDELIHALPYENSMSQEAKAWLHHHFEAEILQLEQVLKWDCSDWLADC